MKTCLWCQSGTEFYKSIRQPCKECWKFTLKVKRLLCKEQYNMARRERRRKEKVMQKRYYSHLGSAVKYIKRHKLVGVVIFHEIIDGVDKWAIWV